MNADALDVLLRARKELSGEISALADELAGKRKALESLSTTIDYLRGWRPEGKVAEAEPDFEPDTIRAAIEDFFLGADGPVHIEEICSYLERLRLIPIYSASARSRIATTLGQMPDIRKSGYSAGARYELIAVTASPSPQSNPPVATGARST